ncbi:MAG TPA: helix-turn-helix domain-containing protein [Solirubrobacteraceae bacterium]|nr:helix-turn-helix domain-containing protein [Solirubrobacteraceae bacterium]
MTAAPDTPAPLRRDAARNRQLILEAARAEFAERGLEASLDDIARRAGVGIGTVYRRFAGKEELIEALFADRMAEVVAIADEALANPDPWSGFVFWVTRLAEIQAADRGLKALLSSTSHGRDRFASAREQIAPRVVQLIARAQEQGRLRADVAPSDLALAGYMLSAVADYAGTVDREVWRRQLTLVLDGLRARRSTISPMPVPPLAVEQLADVMRGGA